MLIDRRLLREALHERGRLGAAVLLGGLAGAAACVQWMAAARFVDGVFLGGETPGHAAPALLLFAGASGIRMLLGCGSDMAAVSASLRLRERIRSRLARRIVELGPVVAGVERSAELTTTLTEGVDALEPAFSQFLPQLGVAVVTPVLILSVVAARDPLSGLILLVTGPLVPLFMLLIGRLALDRSHRQWRALSLLGNHLLDSLEGLATLRLFGQVGRRIEATRAATELFRETTLDVVRVAFLSAFALEMIGTLSTALVAVQVGVRLLYGRMAFDAALTVLMLAPEFFAPLRALGTRFHAAAAANAAAGRVYELLGEPCEAAAAPVAAGQGERGGEIVLRDVVCRYPDATADALRGVNLTLPERGLVAIVGRSGAGKSTLARVLLGWLQPTSGTCCRGGKPWRALPGEVAWLSQHPYLFHGSVKENLRAADPEASDERLRDALRMAAAERFVDALPDGMETVIGERASRLSAGQAQRLALGRTLLQDADLVILDEPTSNLDPETEAAVSAAMSALARTKLVVVIAHRLRTCRSADLILVMDAGAVAEAGRHDDLIAACGRFARLASAAGGVAS